MNDVSLVGRLTADPELKQSANGTPYVKFSIGVDRGLSKEIRERFESENRATADFPRIAVFGKLAEIVCQYMSKGALIGVSGSVRTDNFDGNNGEKIFLTEIAARKIRFLESKKQMVPDELRAGIEVEVHDDIPF
ncbi:MAG: single-stranded DNA-binding protein [Clostridia bacterium]|nr:single-stranded DNA-binding protein [Clostridia bacterium]